MLALRPEFFECHAVYFENIFVLMHALARTLRVEIAAAVAAEFGREIGAGDFAFVDHIHFFVAAAEEFVVFAEQRDEFLHERRAVLVNALREDDQWFIVGFEQVFVEVISFGEELQEAVSLGEYLVVLKEIAQVTGHGLAEYAIEKAAAFFAAVADEVGIVRGDEYHRKKADMVAQAVVMLFIGHENLALAALQAACDLNVLLVLVENAVDEEEVGGVADAERVLVVKCALGKGEEIDCVEQVGFAAAVLAHDTVHMFSKSEGLLLIAFKVGKTELF